MPREIRAQIGERPVQAKRNFLGFWVSKAGHPDQHPQAQPPWNHFVFEEIAIWADESEERSFMHRLYGYFEILRIRKKRYKSMVFDPARKTSTLPREMTTCVFKNRRMDILLLPILRQVLVLHWLPLRNVPFWPPEVVRMRATWWDSACCRARETTTFEIVVRMRGTLAFVFSATKT